MRFDFFLRRLEEEEVAREQARTRTSLPLLHPLQIHILQITHTTDTHFTDTHPTDTHAIDGLHARDAHANYWQLHADTHAKKKPQKSAVEVLLLHILITRRYTSYILDRYTRYK